MTSHPPQIKLAKRLRKTQTDAERRLWARLGAKRLAGVKFRRQQPIGPYIADFVCFEHGLIVELDGGHHQSSEQLAHDKKRTAWLESQGFRVLRFWDNEVLSNTEGVLEKLYEAVRGSSTLSLPLPSRERGQEQGSSSPIEGEGTSGRSDNRPRRQASVSSGPPSPRGRELEGGGRPEGTLHVEGVRRRVHVSPLFPSPRAERGWPKARGEVDD